MASLVVRDPATALVVMPSRQQFMDAVRSLQASRSDMRPALRRDVLRCLNGDPTTSLPSDPEAVALHKAVLPLANVRRALRTARHRNHKHWPKGIHDLLDRAVGVGGLQIRTSSVGSKLDAVDVFDPTQQVDRRGGAWYTRVELVTARGRKHIFVAHDTASVYWKTVLAAEAWWPNAEGLDGPHAYNRWTSVMRSAQAVWGFAARPHLDIPHT